MRMVEVSGNTFPVKERLKKLGARWDPDDKVWRVPEDKVKEAQRLVDSAPEEEVERPTHCVVCGVEGDYPRVKIYRSGECQDCYEERKGGY
jgi:hypothetical protein